MIKNRSRALLAAIVLPVVLASDGPLSAEHIQEAAKGGVTAVIQTGYLGENENAVAVCEQHALSMVLTGTRHFRH